MVRSAILIGSLLVAAATSACTEPASVPPLTVTGVSPGSGPGAGGTSVTITGTNFIDITGVAIGNGLLGSPAVVSDSQITGLTPPSAGPGAKDVIVTSSSRGSATCVGCFTYTSGGVMAPPHQRRSVP